MCIYCCVCVESLVSRHLSRALSLAKWSREDASNSGARQYSRHERLSDIYGVDLRSANYCVQAGREAIVCARDAAACKLTRLRAQPSAA